IVNPPDAAIDRSPLTRNSRPIMMTAIHAGTRLGLNCTSVTNAAAIKSLSAMGSSRIPIVVIWPRLRARYPSIPSVIDAAMKIAEASNSLAPCSLLKRLEDKIQISRGILKMRISVMELGRFTAAQQFSGRPPEDSLIILHGAGERNKRNIPESG